MKLDTHLYLLLRLIRSGIIQLFTRINSWHAPGQLYFSVFTYFSLKTSRFYFNCAGILTKNIRTSPSIRPCFSYTCNSSENLQGRVLWKVVVPFKLLCDRKTFTILQADVSVRALLGVTRT